MDKSLISYFEFLAREVLRLKREHEPNLDEIESLRKHNETVPPLIEEEIFMFKR